MLQGLSIGGEARETDEELIVNLENPLEIGGYSLKLNTESPITGNGEAVLAHHSNQGTSVVLEDRHLFFDSNNTDSMQIENPNANVQYLFEETAHSFFFFGGKSSNQIK